MTRESILEYAAALRPRYQTARKAEKRVMLDEFCRLTGYHRKAAIRLLGRGATRAAGTRRGRPRSYDPVIVPTLVQLWEASDRLSPSGWLLGVAPIEWANFIAPRRRLGPTGPDPHWRRPNRTLTSPCEPASDHCPIRPIPTTLPVGKRRVDSQDRD